MTAPLSGRTALVTGASGHLGRAIALALCEAGACVLVNSRSAERCNALVSDLRERGHQAEPAVFDVTSTEDVARFLKTLSGAALDVVVNNAHQGSAGTIATSNEKEFQAAFDIAVTAAHRLILHSLPNLRRAVAERGDASIINIASMYGLVSPDLRNYDTPQVSNPPFYGAAKAGLLQLTRYAACEFGHEGIRCNALAPGPFPSDRVQGDDPAFVERLAARVPLGRIGRAEEIGGPVVFLASPSATFINGAVLPVDGGWTAW